MAITTTNGTNAIEKSKNAGHGILLASFLNVSSVAEYIKSIDKKDQAPVEEKPRPIPFTRTKPPVTTAPVQTSNINTGQQINTSLASLLGSNPIEAAKNMEILQRRNQ